MFAQVEHHDERRLHQRNAGVIQFNFEGVKLRVLNLYPLLGHLGCEIRPFVRIYIWSLANELYPGNLPGPFHRITGDAEGR